MFNANQNVIYDRSFAIFAFANDTEQLSCVCPMCVSVVFSFFMYLLLLIYEIVKRKAEKFAKMCVRLRINQSQTQPQQSK